MTIPIPRSSPFRRPRAILWLVALAAGTLVRAEPAKACWDDPIIFDPQSFAQHIQQFQQLVQQIADMREQITNQLKGLASLNNASSLAGNIPQQVQSLQEQLHASAYQTGNERSVLQKQFPPQMQNVSDGQYNQFQAQWTQSYRQALVENRQLQNTVYQEMQPTSQAVQQIVSASNAAPGEKAAVQAHNDLIAVLSGELTKLEVLRASRLRAKIEKRARLQSEDAYARAQGQVVLTGMGQHAQASTAVTGIFEGGNP